MLTMFVIFDALAMMGSQSSRLLSISIGMTDEEQKEVQAKLVNKRHTQIYI
jgi:hypothetical protein